MNADWLAAFSIGLVGAGHCLGMCGGIASVITVGINPDKQRLRWLYLLFYNVGRILSYGLIGGLFGGVIAAISHLTSAYMVLASLRFGAGILMLLLALYIGEWWKGLVYIEQIGQKIWQPIAPYASRLLPLNSPIAALPFGFLWGWLPCGLVYSTLSLAAVSANSFSGAMTMIAFGMGTLPAMLLIGGAAGQFHMLLKNKAFKQVTGLLLLAYGLHTCFIAVRML
ncbi:sulfite exporter TauE/SafE family protein [Thaumasiovibrio sp. DFM-14]|uniref:sulfite exporter TauE/SafE family protein n=1 Tax=Thaumasiovibrio sp. DFM-14 TaxID=3384792 RepID=UPI0039A30010